ncbi:MAG: hypothetical protein A2Z29_00940 [Chloroflexi bacterium RBG_16_56_11]|nr:MAG: hypothetical protein A2Z29_00940 [Chloroflexi bacterium RBG_16_56_11]
MGKIVIGISAWADRSLVASGFYPAAVNTPAGRLRYYSAQFNVAEIDASYHYFPTRRNLELWLENTPGDFTFDIRAFSLFTGHPTPYTSLPRGIREKYADRIEKKASVYQHHLPPEAIEELWEATGRTAEAFAAAGKLGAIVFQFPPWFHPGPDNLEYIKQCRERLPRHRLAVEFRVGTWLDDTHRESTLKFLKGQELALVCVDEPQGFRTSLPPLGEVTASPGIVRFHGRNAAAWELKGVSPGEKFRYLYDETELQEWVPRLKGMAEAAGAVHVIFTNKYADSPVRNALQLKEMLSGGSSPKPAFSGRPEPFEPSAAWRTPGWPPRYSP